MHYMKTTYPI